ncbi:MAG: DnaJ domain-containing protein [Mycobacteriales bacterium]
MEPVWAWRVLGLPPGSAPDEVRRAFRQSAQLLHPDRASDLPAEVRAEAARRMTELAEAYRVCSAISRGAPPPPPRATDHNDGGAVGTLRAVGGQAARMLAETHGLLRQLAPWDAFRAGLPTSLTQQDNAEASREVVTLLEQVAAAWPGTAEGDTARVLLVTSVAARNSLSTRERAGHLVLVVDIAARDEAWDSLSGRDELAVAQVVHDHPTAADDLRRRARERLIDLDDWVSLARDADPDVRRTAHAHLLLQRAQLLLDRADWTTRKGRPAYDDDIAVWQAEVRTLSVDSALPQALRARLTDAGQSLASAVRRAARQA